MQEARVPRTVGVDIGSQKSILVLDDGDIVRSDTGSISVPTLVTFAQRARYVGDEAASFQSPDGTVPLLPLCLGRSPEQVRQDASLSALLQHSCSQLLADAEDSAPCMQVNYGGSSQRFSVAEILAIPLGHYARHVEAAHGPDVRLAFPLPHGTPERAAAAVVCAARIAGVPPERIDVVDAAEALVATYNRKLAALRPVDLDGLNGKVVIIVDMGHTQTSVVAVRVSVRPNEAAAGSAAARVEAEASAVAVAASTALGAMSFDVCLYDHLAKVVEGKFKVAVTPGSKRGLRLLKGCERLRKLLSQLAEAQVTIENITDDGDATFSLKRDELSALCSQPLMEFKDLLRSVLPAAPEALGVGAVAGVEVLGGGVRMQLVQAAIAEVFGEKTFGAKLDDSSVALGAALLGFRSRDDKDDGATLFSKYEVAQLVVPANHLSVSSLEDAISRERAMLAQDAEVRAVHAERNAMEALVYECKSALNSRHSGLIDSDLLNRRLEEFEQWLWDNTSDDITLFALQSKHAEFKGEVAVILEAYKSAIASEKHQLEIQLEREAKLAEEQRQEEDGDEDHDTRKLKKADRMRLVVKNKDEGNELFKGGNIRPAAARYHKSLTHIAKFFDLSPEDQVEVNALKLSLFLNLSQCYIKLENWDNALKNIEDALAIDPNNSKALFRRATVWEAKKDYEKSLKDFKRAEELTPQDKLIGKAVERVSKLVQKEREKEKKMWGRAFAGGEAST